MVLKKLNTISLWNTPSRKTGLPFKMFCCSLKFSAGTNVSRVPFTFQTYFRKRLVNSKQPIYCLIFPQNSNTFLLSFNCNMSVVPPHCQPLNSTMCKNLNYIYVEMPNFWGDNTQEEADARIQVFSPLVNSGCSPSLRVFLCLLYFPPCVVNFRKMIPPCRELCEDARRGCNPGPGFRSALQWTVFRSANTKIFRLNPTLFLVTFEIKL